MQSLTYSEFHNKLYYGADIELVYGKWYYHISSGSEQKNNKILHSISVAKYDISPDSNNAPSVWKEIFSIASEDTLSNIEAFMDAAIFDELCFNDIDDKIKVLYS